MKSIILFSPVSLSNLSSGISIRLDQLKSKFEDLGIKSKVVDTYKKGDTKNVNYAYIMVSTKADSISAKVAREFGKDKKLIVDLYTPIFLEKQAYLSKWKPKDWYTRAKMISVVKKIIESSNYFIVANTRQKEYWLKTAKSLKDPIDEGKIFVLPTGAPKLSPVKKQRAKVILWFGGIYPWLDPTPLVESFAKVAPQKPNWKLRVLGGFHPNTGYQGRFKKIINLAMAKIKSSQLEVIPWQSLIDLPNFFKDVDFAVHLPKETEEDYYSHRVRLLTLLNCGIPIITTGNDMISDLVDDQKAGTKTTRDNLTNSLKLAIGDQPLVNSWSNKALGIEGNFIKSQEEFSRFKLIFKNQ